MPDNRQTYLGDSVYAETDGYGIAIYLNNGLGATNRIYLEPEVLNALNRYSAMLKNLRDAEFEAEAQTRAG